MDLLRLPTLHILQIDEDENDIHIQAESLSPPTCCALCQHPVIHKHEKKLQRYMDLPIRGKRVGIMVHRRRYLCCRCGRTFFEPLFDMDEHHFCTCRLTDYIQRQALHRTFVSIADEVGLTEGSIRLLFKEFSASLQARWQEQPVRVLGIDELYLLHKPRCILCDLEHHSIVELLRDRNKSTLLLYLQGLPTAVREQIAVVCTDMYANYHEIVHQALPQAALVVDKWHVLKMLSECLETVRKEIRERLPDSQRRTLMHDRYLLLKRPCDLSERDTLILQAWLGNFPRLAAAYRLKESFYQVYEAPTEEEALSRYFAWFTQIPPDVREAFLPFVLAVEHYGDAIFAYFTHRYTAGYTEGLNGRIKLLVKQSRGFSFEVIRAKALLTNGLRKPVRPGYGKTRRYEADVIEIPERTHDATSILQ